jgi:protein-tyrosine-phosphatase
MADAAPTAVLFLCTMNVARSPMAAAALRHLAGSRIYVRSAGVHVGAPDPLVTAVMAELDIDMSGHRPRRFEDLGDGSFDLIIALSRLARTRAGGWTLTAATGLEYWPTPDPTLAEGSREQRLAAYRTVRDQLLARLHDRFASSL